jgi:hypothetical protein
MSVPEFSLETEYGCNVGGNVKIGRAHV